MSLLSIEKLEVEFATDRGWLKILRGVDLEVQPGEVVGLVGESGSGKSVTSLAVMGLLPSRHARITGGRVHFGGRNLVELSQRQLEDVRGAEIGMVFQEPMTSLNPALTIGTQIGEVVRRHRGASRREARAVAIEMIDRVGMPDPELQVSRYPHELSGGMRQRVVIAMALACQPRLLIADEPTTALDVTIQAQVLDLLRSLTADQGLSMILVTHDLGVVAELCDRVAVMYAGEIVEEHDGHTIFERPLHPYTAGLMAASALGRDDADQLCSIPGAPPPPWHLPPGCKFAPRCPHVRAECRESPIELRRLPGTPAAAAVRCVRADELDLSVVP